ncbi:hypothetical protein JMJ77_0001813 [Colletotrichum scovillei]|uniref:Uncharacterized protein n=1 Tax=Colletotrichum scovillei TaxID=1209932 RepID=A0A9P7R8D2_9PEZI|nr:hypothetical protein JMJ77_0001813 [Colletotrichum scovillei]KAG7070223.1 hypothetical protein JMJ76_0001479 [Colletotrichum scovillei]KAG7078472.1 hypothetical protein JMJ78_0002143 [Colletotrichum scovillei]
MLGRTQRTVRMNDGTVGAYFDCPVIEKQKSWTSIKV